MVILVSIWLKSLRSFSVFERFSGFAGESFELFFIHDYCLSLAIAGGYDKQLHSLIYSL